MAWILLRYRLAGQSIDAACWWYMQILFLADAVFGDKPGGSRTAAMELARRLTLKGHSLTFLVGKHLPGSLETEFCDGIRIVRYEGSGEGQRFIKSGRQAMLGLLKEQSFDVVHTHFAFAAIGPLSALPKSIPRVRTFHGPWDEESWFDDTSRTLSPPQYLKSFAKRVVRYGIEKENLNNSRKVIVLSNAFGNKLKKYGVGDRKIERIAGGVDLKTFQPLTHSRIADAKAGLGLPANRRIIFTVRRLTARMGLENLIEAMPEIVSAVPDVLLIVGGQGPLRNKLEEMTAAKGLSSHIRFTGFVPGVDLAAYYQTADLFVLPTVALEGFGLVTVEALSSGTPVIGTPVGATPEILNGLDKRLVSADVSSPALAERIISFFCESWKDDLDSKRLHDYCIDNFSWDNVVEKTQTVYDRLVV